jgi:outer membrane biosynthesis protein TonB
MDSNLMALIVTALVVVVVIFLFRRNEPAPPAQPPTVQPIVPANYGLLNPNNFAATPLNSDHAIDHGCNIVTMTTPGSHYSAVTQPALEKAPIHVHHHYVDARTVVTKTETVHHLPAPKPEPPKKSPEEIKKEKEAAAKKPAGK